jgi:hypothetical protein
MCMWQSHALAGALSLGASVPDEYGTCWASLLRTEMPDTAADIAAKDAPLRSVRRAIM